MAHILLVEDDQDLANSLAEMLEADGHVVSSAHHGQEALRCLDIVQPDLIVLDLIMPVMDGWQFVAELRKAGPLRVPLLVISADLDTEKKARQLGAQGHLTKPFSLELFLAEVGRLASPTGRVP